MISRKKIVLVSPSLTIGGMEKVITELGNYFAKENLAEIDLFTLIKGPCAFKIHPKITLHQPNIDHQKYNRFLYSIKSVVFIRKGIRAIQPDAILSFGDRYNAFVIMACFGLNEKVFVSNRMNPYLSNGRIIDLLNRIFYPFSAGIVAQTSLAASVFKKKYGHDNVKVIPNPIKSVKNGVNLTVKNIILNVGRFGDEKNQHYLVNYFGKIGNNDWKVIFLGDGAKKKFVESKVRDLNLTSNIEFAGSVSNTDAYYSTSKIFAFTSTTEGFPNALGEAMSAGMACISFDCIAGPADLIDDGINGFLIPVGNDDEYVEKLKMLMEDEALRKRFGDEARKKIEQLRPDKIGQQFYEFMLPNN